MPSSKPICFSTSAADYILVLAQHGDSDTSWVRQKFDALVTEFPMISTLSVLNRPDFPNNRTYYNVTDEFSPDEMKPVIRELTRRETPIVFADLPMLASDAYQTATERRDQMRHRGSLGKWLLGSGGMLGLSLLAARRKKGRPSAGEKKGGMPRRDFLKRVGIAAATGLVVSGAGDMVQSAFSSPVIGLEGRSALIAQRCEEYLAHRLAVETGRKPVIMVHAGRNHSDIEKYLVDPSSRHEMIRQMRPQLEKLPAPYQRFLREFFIIRYTPDPKRNSREVVPTDLPWVRRSPATSRSAGVSRRVLFRPFLLAAAIGRGASKNKSRPPNETRRGQVRRRRK